MELEKLNEFIEFMKKNNLCELEIEEEGKRIKLKKASPQQQAYFASPAASQKQVEPPPQEKVENLVEVKSPMVGTFYRAPSPGANSYVEVGEVIKPGDIVCIVEAMKLMNEIKAEVGGRVSKILVENGESVEFGQVLFLIEPA
ncbi:MAG: acetyl-CoA carboxylase biotin carboxyl carrier protein [Candidatus Omnitrophota bacterium]|nr:MAG: acetyl-CoA carboxylase biotin carboxyl carrier protein [Candidatus Omnitrophota bacterium]